LAGQNHSATLSSWLLVFASGVVRRKARVIERCCSRSAARAVIG